MFGRNKEPRRAGGGKDGSKTVPLLPLRDIIIFPYMVVPLFVGREKSINALERASAQDKEIFLSAQKKAKTQDPSEEDIYEVGTLSTIIQMLRLPDGTVKVLVEGRKRARHQALCQDGGVLPGRSGRAQRRARDDRRAGSPHALHQGGV